MNRFDIAHNLVIVSCFGSANRPDEEIVAIIAVMIVCTASQSLCVYLDHELGTLRWLLCMLVMLHHFGRAKMAL